MKHFVIINEWTQDFENGVTVLGIAHDYEKAKIIFNNAVDKEKKIANENGWEIFEDKDMLFEAGARGCYINNHTSVLISEVDE